ncbi:MAG: ROK family protein [Cryobacterium sp.]
MHGNSHDDVRRHNLSSILRLVHQRGPTSRAGLTRLTGLNRSTISALVAQLVELGLVEERQPNATNQVGRPSPVVAVNGRVAALAVNPEIDAVTVGLVGLDGLVHRRIRRPTPESPSAAEAVRIAAAAIDELRGDGGGQHDVVGVGVAVPGLVRTHDGLVRHAPHLGWIDEPFAEQLAAAVGCPVSAANDASLGLLAEHDFGSGVGCTDLIYLNGGASGIGGGLMVGGRVVGGHAGYAGEFGHTRVSDSAATDSAGFRGTLEAEVTRSGLLAALQLPAETDADTLEHALLASDSARVEAEVHRQLHHLAVALAGAINLLNPQLVVLGGFLAALLAADPQRLQSAVAALTLAEVLEGVRIEPAGLGSDLLLIGAAELAFEGVLNDPQSFRS